MYDITEEKLSVVRNKALKSLSNPNLTGERLEIVTHMYEQTKSFHISVRRAIVLKAILEKMTININDYEYVVGGLTPEPFSAAIYPEFSADWILEEIDSFDSRSGDHFKVPDDTKSKVKGLIPKWKGETVRDRASSLMSDGIFKGRESRLIGFESMFTGGIAHSIPRYEIVLEKGIDGIVKEIKNKVDNLSISNPEDFEKFYFYKAALISCENICAFARRYSKLAFELMEKATNVEEQQRLLKISKNCNRVPDSPPKTFYEALQTLWFVHLIHFIEQNGLAVTLGRIDQYLYPFYKRDRERGIIDRESAKNLLVNFWIKCNEVLKLFNNISANYYAGFPITQAPQVGGFLPDGSDATNELSELILEAEESVRLPQPDIAVLWTNTMKDSFVKKATKIVPLSMKPKFFNAEIGMKHLLLMGATLEEARDYAFVGCVESTIPGKTWGWHNTGMINLAKCIEYVFTQGIDSQTNKQVGVRTKNPSEFKSFDDFYTVFQLQLNNAIELLVTATHAIESSHKDLIPLPYASLFVEDCIKKGRDLNCGGAKYNLTGIQAVGLATAADSLVVIKKEAFENNRWDLIELFDMIKNDYKDKEEERLYILNKVPKFGNDDDVVDNLAKDIFNSYCETVAQYKNLRGGPFIPGFFSVSSHVPFGLGVLTCDGRKKNDPISDGCSPSQGRIKNGPTAVASSVAKLDHTAALNGTLLNAKFNLTLFEDGQNIEKLTSFILAFMKMNAFHLQMNVVDPKVLKEAQDDPEQHPDLLVRVAAYVALFSQLSKEVQDEIIARSELGF